MKPYALACVALCAITAPVAAQQVNPLESEALMKKGINEVGTAYTFYGSGFTQKAMKEPAVPGGRFIRVDVGNKGANPWDVGAQYAIDKPIKAGDVVFFAVFLRAPNLKDGETARVPGTGVGQAAAPYAPIATTEAHVSNQWNVYYASTKASRAWGKGEARASLHLAADKQVLDLGPLIVLDLGPDYDMTTLPSN